MDAVPNGQDKLAVTGEEAEKSASPQVMDTSAAPGVMATDTNTASPSVTPTTETPEVTPNITASGTTPVTGSNPPSQDQTQDTTTSNEESSSTATTTTTSTTATAVTSLNFSHQQESVVIPGLDLENEGNNGAAPEEKKEELTDSQTAEPMDTSTATEEAVPETPTKAGLGAVADPILLPLSQGTLDSKLAAMSHVVSKDGRVSPLDLPTNEDHKMFSDGEEEEEKVDVPDFPQVCEMYIDRVATGQGNSRSGKSQGILEFVREI